MEWFGKGIYWTIAIGCAIMGMYVGLLVLRIAVEVAGWMLGSSFGTIMLAFILWEVYKRSRDKISKES